MYFVASFEMAGDEAGRRGRGRIWIGSRALVFGLGVFGGGILVWDLAMVELVGVWLV